MQLVLCHVYYDGARTNLVALTFFASLNAPASDIVTIERPTMTFLRELDVARNNG